MSRLWLTEKCHRAIDAGAEVAFVAFLHGRIVERIDSGRSFDCDEFRCLDEFTRKSAREHAARSQTQVRDVSEVIHGDQEGGLLLKRLSAESQVSAQQSAFV